MYKILVIGPDQSTVLTASAWPGSQDSLTEEQKNSVQGNFFDVSSEAGINDLGNEISDSIGNHYDSLNAEESDETMRSSSENGEAELLEESSSAVGAGAE